MSTWQVIHGDCLDALRALPDNSVDAVVTDPPYGLSFMGKKWDYDVPATEVWAECLRVLKPGGHLLAFAGTRTQHRMCVRIEDAGFEIRDMIAWVYGSGFPKSLDVSKAIDKAAGAERDVVGSGKGRTGKAAQPNGGSTFSDDAYKWPGVFDITAPATEAARQWDGWGTALKPSWESVTWATKPTSEQSERATIVSNLSRLEARLWLLLSASAAEKSSRSSQSEYDAACGTAQWDADAITNLRAALCDQMDTSQFESATATALSIVSSWNRILAESWGRESTSTTETESGTTTDLRTLKFSLSQITPESIVAACSRPGGFDANASLAERHFSASVALLRSIHTLSATGRAMSRGAENSLDAGVSPSLDPCIMARKPLTGTVADNVQEWGTGAINIDKCRVLAGQLPTLDTWEPERSLCDSCADIAANSPKPEAPATEDGSVRADASLLASGRAGIGHADTNRLGIGCCGGTTADTTDTSLSIAACGKMLTVRSSPVGKFITSTETSPTIGSSICASCGQAIIADCTNESTLQSRKNAPPGRGSSGNVAPAGRWPSNFIHDGSEEVVEPLGSASRFFYCAKASKADREDGVAGVEHSAATRTSRKPGSAGINAYAGATGPCRNHHPTVKPTALMQYLCRLVTPLGGTVLDPFTGSGSTGKAAILEGFNFIGIEREAEYVEIARARIAEAERRHSESLVSA